MPLSNAEARHSGTVHGCPRCGKQLRPGFHSGKQHETLLQRTGCTPTLLMYPAGGVSATFSGQMSDTQKAFAELSQLLQATLQLPPDGCTRLQQSRAQLGLF